MNRMLLAAMLVQWTGIAHANLEMTVDLPGGATMELVWIEPGTFLMGSPVTELGRYDASQLGHSDREGPLHEVVLTRGFWLGKTEVTQGQWQAVMATTPWAGQTNVQAAAGNPAVYISRHDVDELLNTLNRAAGESCYRLPTEAQWEFACRAGTSTRWSFGDDENQLEAYAWYRDNTSVARRSYAQTVGTKQPNPWGLFDMHGNVWEWVEDRYANYQDEVQVNPAGPSTGWFCVLRGGGFSSDARDLRSAARKYDALNARYSYLGVRLLRSGPAPTSIAPKDWGQVKSAD